VPAIRKLCEHVDNLSGATVTFENKTRFINRFENHIERNIYRIVQEAINNALKYSKSSQIIVTLEHTSSQLVVSIKDTGIGFDMGNLDAQGYFEKSGNGIFNMKERTAFIGGEFHIETHKNVGTTITIHIPLES
jgi:signal transduction histidine kinase